MASSRRVTRETVLLPNGTTIEYTLAPPRGSYASFDDARSSSSSTEGHSEQGNKLAICLHPWSRLGGRLNDPVLQLVSAPLQGKGCHVLCYNSRGTGNSSGWPSLSGSSEVEDMKELVQWALVTVSNVTSLVILGYSYGSLIASCLPVHPEIPTTHILLSYPLGPRHWLTAFHGGTYVSALSALVRDPRAHVLLVYGDRDDFTAVEKYGEWSSQLVQEAAAGESENGRVKVVKVEGASHFWREDEPERQLVQEVEAWLL